MVCDEEPDVVVLGLVRTAVLWPAPTCTPRRDQWLMSSRKRLRAMSGSVRLATRAKPRAVEVGGCGEVGEDSSR